MDNENLEINEEKTENVENEDIVVENSEDFATRYTIAYYYAC